MVEVGVFGERPFGKGVEQAEGFGHRRGGRRGACCRPSSVVGRHRAGICSRLGHSDSDLAGWSRVRPYSVGAAVASQNVATADDCEQALHILARRMDEHGAGGSRSTGLERTLSCTLRDLKITFAGRLADGQLCDIRRTENGHAQIRLEMTSDDLVRLVDGDLNFASAWATGRVKVHAGVRDMIRLRSMF